MKSQDQLLQEAKARGAVIVDDSQPGSGFDDEVNTDFACIKGQEFQQRTDDPDVLRAAERAAESIPAEIDEITKELQEENSNSMRRLKLTHQEDYLNWEPGKIMWLGDFFSLLQKIRPDAFMAEFSYMGLRGIGFVIGGMAQYSGVSIANGNMPEWTKLRLDRWGVPTSEQYRGWRAVLLGLIQRGHITETQANETFGKPIGPRSRPWYRTLFAIRNNRCAECGKEHCECSDGWDYLRADNYSYEIPQAVERGQRQEIDTSERLIWTP